MTFNRKAKWCLSILGVIILAIIIFRFTFATFVVAGPAMIPTLFDGDLVLVNKVSYRFDLPQRGDIVVFRYPNDQRREFIQRVIAVAGDTIEIKDGKVLVNDRPQNEKYILVPTPGLYPQQTVPEGRIFAMGDNRVNSQDSRFRDVGFVSYELIVGKVVYIDKAQ